MSQPKPIIAVTAGDIAGIGPEILVKAMGHPEIRDICRPLLIGDLWVLQRAASDLTDSVPMRGISDLSEARWGHELPVLDPHLVAPAELVPAEPSATTGQAMIAYTQTAVRLLIEGLVHGAVGGPHSKKAAEDGGFHFEGYPGLIAEMTDSPHPFLMLVAGRLRVSNVTLHVSMRRALEILDEALVYHCIQETHAAVQTLGVPNPRIAVAGLNPHAGEERLFGDEDEDIIRPAVAKACARGINAFGPMPADSLFVGIASQGGPSYDAYVAMYHDQAHLPVKIVAFKKASAVAIGVPVNWATVDHGCALDIAWQNRADEGVLVETIRLVASRADCD